MSALPESTDIHGVFAESMGTSRGNWIPWKWSYRLF